MDVVRKWPYEKQMKWLIALGMIADNQKKAIEEVSKKKEESGEIYRVEGDKVAYYL